MRGGAHGLGRRAVEAAAMLCLWLSYISGSDLASDGQLPPETSFPADAGCPCLSAEEVTARVLSASGPGGCPNNTLPATIPGQIQGTQCLDYRIGSESCRSWGQITLVCEIHKQVSFYVGAKTLDIADAEVAKWCNQGWCYVDPHACSSPVEASSMFPKSDLWYSYETCGYVDTYGPRLLDKSLQSVSRSTLRYTYPGDDGSRLWRSDSGEAKGSFVAIFQMVMNVITASLDIKFQEVEITEVASDATTEMFGYHSSYTACAVMIAYNKTDICVGPHWSLPERHSMAQFVYSWDGDQVYLMTYVNQVQGSQLLAGIFLPFKGEVWVVLFLTVIFTIILFGYIEISPRLSATFKPASAPVHGKLPWRETLHGWLNYTTQVLLLSIEGVLDFHPEGYNPLSVAGKLLKAAWVMFMVVFMATYTANLAAILAGQSPTEFASIQDAVTKKATICVPSVMVDKLSDLIPGLEALSVPVGFAEVFSAMDAGLCRAGLSYDAVYDIRPTEHCNKIAVGNPVTNLPVALLSQPFVSQHLNLAVESLTSGGLTQLLTEEYNTMYSEEVNNMVGGCKAIEDDEVSGRLSLIHMSSLFILFILAAAGAVLCDTMERFFPMLIMRTRAIPFEVAAESGPGNLYLRDEYKDTYSVSLPPGLRPRAATFDSDDSTAMAAGSAILPEIKRRFSVKRLADGSIPGDPGTPMSTDEMLAAPAMNLSDLRFEDQVEKDEWQEV